MGKRGEVDLSRRRLLTGVGGVAAAGTVIALTDETEASAAIPSATYGINVKDFGAIGDGNTDDTAAIQAAADSIDYASHDQGRVLYFPSGSYMISKALRFEAGQRWLGEMSSWVTTGTGATRIVAKPDGTFTNGPTPDSYMAKFDGDYWHWGSFENISFDGSNVGGLGGLQFKSLGENSVLRECGFVNLPGTAVYTTGDLATGLMESVNVRYCGVGVHVDNFNQGALLIDSLTGDENTNLFQGTNWGPMASFTATEFKAENNISSPKQDPVFLFDNVHGSSITINGGTAATANVLNDVIKAQNLSANAPVFTIVGVEAANLSGAYYGNIFHDATNNRTVKGALRGQRHPLILFNQVLVMDSGAAGATSLRLAHAQTLEWGDASADAATTTVGPMFGAGSLVVRSNGNPQNVAIGGDTNNGYVAFTGPNASFVQLGAKPTSDIAIGASGDTGLFKWHRRPKIMSTSNVTTTATAGTHAPPTKVVGYIMGQDPSGKTIKIPYYY